MRGFTLLERLEDPARARLGGEPDPSDVLASVLANLSHILNTRAGSVMTRPDYGMPDFNDMVSNFPDALAMIAKAIRYQINEFEPRLRHPLVRHVPDPTSPLLIRYTVTAELVVGSRSESVSLETTLDDAGHVAVKL